MSIYTLIDGTSCGYVITAIPEQNSANQTGKMSRKSSMGIHSSTQTLRSSRIPANPTNPIIPVTRQ